MSWRTKLNRTISIFDKDVEEEVMEILILKMKAGFSPSVVYSRMEIGALENVLYITERNILRMREESIFFTICWEELLGCYDTVKPYMNYIPEPVRGQLYSIITLESDEEDFELENNPVNVKKEEFSSELAGLDFEAGTESVPAHDYEVEPEPVKDEGAVASATGLNHEEDIKKLQNIKKSASVDRRSPSEAGVSSSKAGALYCRGPQTKFEVRDLALWRGDLLAICPRTSRGGNLYYILVVRTAEFAKQIVGEINGLNYKGRTIKMQHAKGRDLDIDHFIRNHGGHL